MNIYNINQKRNNKSFDLYKVNLINKVEEILN